MSRIVTLVCVLLLLGFCLVSSGQAEPERAAIARKPSYSWRQTDSSLALLNHGRVVWQLNFNKKEGKPYFHPVGLIDGTVLTWLRPADHRWHRALWFSWKYINGLNYWEENPTTGLSQGRTEIVFIKAIPQDDYSARIAMKLSYHPPERSAVLTEWRYIQVSAPDEIGRYRIEWVSTFTAGDKNVLLDRTPIPGEKDGKGFGGYAGLSVRMAKATRGWQFVDSEGRKDKEAHGKRARWVDFSGEISGDKAAGITIFDHPENLRHPSPWYVAKGMPYFSPAVLFNKPYTLPAGNVLRLRYHILIHPGRPDKQLLEAEWKEYVFRPIERFESAKKLAHLGKALLIYANDHEDKLPDTMQELKESGLSNEELRWLLENVEYLGKGKTVLGPPDTVIAYDKTMLAERKGTNVFFNRGYVAFKTPEQLKKLGIKPGHETDVQHESAEKLRQLALAALMYADDHKGKFAADLNKLKPYLGKKNLFEWIVENVEYIGQGKMTDVRRPHKRAVAYDRTLLGKGYGTYVAFMDGHVEFLRPEQVEKLGIK